MNYNASDIDKAKQLLEAWYEGATDRADEAWLELFFSGAGELPAGLEAERGIFVALRESASGPVSMPEECRRSIVKALDAEIRRESVWRRRRILWGAAACMLLVSGVTFMTRHIDVTGSTAAEAIAEVATDSAEASAGRGMIAANVKADTDTSAFVTALGKAEERRIASASPAKGSSPSKRHAAQKRTGGVNLEGSERGVAEQRHDPAPQPLYACSYTEEEQEMMERGYRVVCSEAEARAVVGLVMAKMQENVVETTYVMDDAAYRFDKVVSTPI